MKVSRSRRLRGFTLIELLVVLLIIGLVSAVTLPTVLPALSHRQVSESARVLQAALEGARDAAIRANAPRGIRLLPDPSFPGTTAIPMLAANRIVPIEPAGEYTEGHVTIQAAADNIPNSSGIPGNTTGRAANCIEEAQFDPNGLLSPRTSWYWNVRVGDRIQLGGAGPVYTIVGPEVDPNPEHFINLGPPAVNPTSGTLANPNSPPGRDYLFIVNGKDDNGNGFIDEGFDGIDNDGDDLPLPALPGNKTDRKDFDEWESEPPLIPIASQKYTIFRRPYPTQGARVIELPSNVVVDLTTWNTTQERSRLPVDPDTNYVDIMIQPNGQAIPQSIYSTPAKFGSLPFFHFWLAERSDVFEPITPPTGATYTYRLPMPEGTPGVTTTSTTRHLKGDRRLVTLFPRTGMVVTNSIEFFDGTNLDQPYIDAQLGTREAK